MKYRLLTITSAIVISSMIAIYAIFLPASYLLKPKGLPHQNPFRGLSAKEISQRFFLFETIEDFVEAMGPNYTISPEREFPDYTIYRQINWRYRLPDCDETMMLRVWIWHADEPENRLYVGVAMCKKTNASIVVWVCHSESQIQEFKKRGYIAPDE